MLPMENKSNPNQNPYVRPALTQSTTVTQQPVMRPIASPKHGVSAIKVILVLFLMIILGTGVGYGASFFSEKTGTSFVPAALNSNAPVKGKIYGNGDTSVFKDTAEGVLQNGGIDGDGEYHLVRTGGSSQY